MRKAAFPGSFDPPTHAHLAIAQAAQRDVSIDRVDLVLSVRALGKDASGRPPVDARRAVLERVARDHSWLGVVVTDQTLLAEIAVGYDALVMGADKWRQIRDPAWYGSVAARDRALASLPRVLVVPRAGIVVRDAEILEIDPIHRDASSTRARSGETDLVLPQARQEPPCGA